MIMLSKWKYKALAIFLVMLFIVGGFLSLRTSFISEHPLVKALIPPKADLEFQLPKLHYYDNPNVSLERVHIQAFYLVPRKSLNGYTLSWKEDFTGALEELKKFYESQFGNSSELTFSLLDIPVVAPNEFVDSLPTGLRRATLVDLEPIDKFIADNITKSSAPFYRKAFVDIPNNAYAVKVIFVEGVSAVGSEGMLLLSRNYITDPAIGYGTSVLAHEFGHTLGMPDLYDYETYEEYSDDLMGSGRYRIINYVYFGDDIKIRMG